MLQIIPPISLNNEISVNQIQTYANGSFTLSAQKSQDFAGIVLFNSKGVPKISAHAQRGVMLANGNYILFNDIQAPHILGILYSPTGNVIYSEFNDFTIFENNWYVLSYNNFNVLYNNKNQEVARNFIEAKVFKNDYALRYNQDNVWKLFSFTGTFLRSIENVEIFLNDDFFLQKIQKEDDVYLLCKHSGKLAIKEKVCSYLYYANKSFVIKTLNGWVAFYDYKGKDRCRALWGTQFLPDGTFLEHAQKSLPKQDIVFEAHYETKTASYIVVGGRYYFSNQGGVTKFFNCFKNEIAIRGTYAWHNQHAVMIVERFVGNRKKYRLFTQFGEVFNTSNSGLIDAIISKLAKID